MKYVKICPRCGHKNDELSEVCEIDNEFLGMVPATLDADSVAPPPAPATDAPAEVEAAPAPAASAAAILALYLDVPATGQCFEVRDGWVLGQAHPSNAAQIQLAEIPGVNYVHRNHCRFDFSGGRWYASAVAQPEYTNPTFINQNRLMPGQSTALRNGDRLTLAAIALNVRILET